MKRFLILTVILVPVLAMAFIGGCGSSTSTNSNLATGDTTSAEFQMVQSSLGDGVDQSVQSALALTFELWDSIPGVSTSPRDHFHPMAAQTGDSLSLSYNYAYTNGWHVFNFEAYAADESDTVVLAGVDSIRFLSDGTPMQVPDSTVDALNIHPHFTMDAYVNGSSMTSDQGLSVMGLTPDMMEPVTVNGSSIDAATLIFDDTAAACTLSVGTHLAINNVVVVLGEGMAECPTSGSVVAGATIDMSCVGDSANSVDINGAWNLTATYNGTSVSMHYTNATTEWNVTEECGESAVAVDPWFFPRE